MFTVVEEIVYSEIGFYDFRNTALHVAAFLNNLAATKTLLANDASTTMKDANEW